MTDQILTPFEQALAKASRALNATEEEVATLRRVAEAMRPDLPEFLLARIDEDEDAARAAIDPERPGAHWQWVTDENDTVVAPGDLQEAQNHQAVSLRTVEEFPTRVGPLPGFITSGIDEVHPGGGEHIARHDPARVLAECEAKRRIVEMAQRFSAMPDDAGTDLVLEDVLRVLALPYAEHPSYRPEWRP